MFGKRCPLPGCEWRPGQPPASSSCSGLRLPPATVTCRPTTIPLSELTWAPARAALDKDKERFCKAVEFSRQTQNSVNQLEFGHNKHHLLLRSSSNRRKILLYRPRVAWRRGILSEEELFYRDWSEGAGLGILGSRKFLSSNVDPRTPLLNHRPATRPRHSHTQNRQAWWTWWGLASPWQTQGLASALLKWRLVCGKWDQWETSNSDLRDPIVEVWLRGSIHVWDGGHEQVRDQCLFQLHIIFISRSQPFSSLMLI